MINPLLSENLLYKYASIKKRKNKKRWPLGLKGFNKRLNSTTIDFSADYDKGSILDTLLDKKDREYDRDLHRHSRSGGRGSNIDLNIGRTSETKSPKTEVITNNTKNKQQTPHIQGKKPLSKWIKFGIPGTLLGGAALYAGKKLYDKYRQ